MGSPAIAQTAIWSATLTADEVSYSSTFYIGCDNGDPSQDNCSSSTVLTDDDFTYDGATYTVRVLYFVTPGNALHLRFSEHTGSAAKTALSALALEVDGKDLPIRSATASDPGLDWIYDSGSIWKDGQTVNLKLKIANIVPTASNGEVETDEDEAYTFAASDFNFADTDTNDALESVKIESLPGNGKLVLEGTDIRSSELPLKVAKAKLDANQLVYEPPADANGNNYTTFTFKVNDGDDDSAASYTMTIDVDPVPDVTAVSVTSAPRSGTTPKKYGLGEKIVFTVTFDEAVTVTGDPVLNFQLANAGNTGAKNAEFVGGSRTTALVFAYTVLAGDVDSDGISIGANPVILDGDDYIRDSDGQDADLTHGAVGTLGSHRVDSSLTPPTLNTVPTAADGEVETDEDAAYTFAAADFNFTDPDAGDALESVKIVSLPGSGTGTLKFDGTAIVSGDLPEVVIDTDFTDEKLTYEPPADANGNDYTTFTFTVNDGDADSASSYTMTIDVTAVNDAPAGAPTISGTATVGQTLTASTAGISDVDGLTGASYSYQWIRVDADGISNPADITSATSQTYVLQAADTGKRVKVKASFTDDDGTDEALTSVAYPASGTVQAPPGAPARLIAVAGNAMAKMAWAAPSEAGTSPVTGYQYQQKADGGSYGAWTATDHGLGVHQTVSGLTNNTAYTFRVRAVNAAGSGAASTETTVTPSTAFRPVIMGDSNAEQAVTFRITITFDRDVPELQRNALVMSGGKLIEQGAPASPRMSRPNGREWTAHVQPDYGFTGWLTIDIPAGAVRDGNGNLNVAAVQYRRLIKAEHVRPRLYMDLAPDPDTGAFRDPSEPVSGPFTVRFNFTTGKIFHIPMTGLELDEIVVTNGTKTNLAQASGDVWWAGDYEVTVTPDPTYSGPFTVTVEEGAAYACDDLDDLATCDETNLNLGDTLALDVVGSNPQVAPPGEPTANATPGDGEVRLTWTAPEYDGTITGWQFRYGEVADPVVWGKWTAIEDATAETTSHTVTGLENGTSYLFQVRAMAGTTAGASSNMVGAAPSSAKPLSPDLSGSPSRSTDDSGGSSFLWRRSPDFGGSAFSLGRSPDSGGGPGGCAVDVTVEFRDEDGSAVAVDALAASDFTVENGRVGTPVADADGLSWTAPARATPGFVGLMRVRLTATERWQAAEQAFRVVSDSDCTPAARNDLASLGLDGLALDPSFDAATTAYTAQAAADQAQTTVTATAIYGTAAVAIAPADADDEAEGHQVALAAGETAVTVTVTPGDGSAAQTYTVTVTRAAAPAAGVLTGFVLVDASDQSTVAALTNGADIDLGVRSGGSFGILAKVASDATVGSVVLALSGAKTVSQTENWAPYSLYGDRDDGNGGRALHGAALPAGTYTLTATAYAARGGSGEALGTRTVPFTVAVAPVVPVTPPPPVLTGFVLVDVSDQSTVAALSDGAAIDLGSRAGGSFGIRAKVASDATVGSVVLALSGAKTVSQTENWAPYSLYGDRDDGNGGRALHGAALPAGTYTLSATAYAARRASGPTLGTRSVSFTVLAPALSVADARAEEGTDATLDFVVSLDRAPTKTVTVAYATADVTATAGADYTATSGTLTFATGETKKTISVPVLDDVWDEGEETLTLMLSSAAGATIADGEATGTIANSDSLQQAWLARFGRTAATHVTDAVGERLRGAGDQGSQLTIGGYRVPLERPAGTPPGRPERSSTSLLLRSERTEEKPFTLSVRRNAPEVEGGATSKGPGAGAEAERALAAKLWGPLTPDEHAGPPGRLAALVTGVAEILGLGSAGPGDATTDSSWLTGPGLDPRLGQSRSLTLDLRQILLGSSFRLTLGADDPGAGTPRLTAWGRFAGTTFNGQDGALALNGDVFTGTVGVDREWDRLLAGVAVAHSRGDGSFTDATPGLADRGQGGVEQTLTSLHPYLRYAVTDRLDVWGLAGYGWGELDLEMANGVTVETDTTLLMGAFGGRGIVLAPEDAGGFQLATRTDAMLTRTSADAAANSAATDADAHRVRVLLEGSRAVAWDDGRRLTPTVEVGLRHDWGDAETGFGLEVGGRVQYADPGLGLTIEGAVRGLLAHEDADYQEWGASGTVRLAPDPAGRGLSVALAPTWGAASSGVAGLWSRQTTQGLAPQGTTRAPGGRLAAEVGYGFAAFDVGLVTPYAGTVLAAGADRTYRVGTRLQVTGRWATGLTLNLEGTRQEAAAGQQPVNQGLRLQVEWRF